MVNGLETIYPFRSRARPALSAAEWFASSARARETECTLLVVVRESIRCERNFGSALSNLAKKVTMVSHRLEYLPYLCSFIGYTRTRSVMPRTNLFLFYSCLVCSSIRNTLEIVTDKNNFFV